MNTFVISDTHFGHEKIISLCNRPFQNKEEMDQKMIENHNSVVSDGDVVIHLGDFMFYKKDTGIFDRLKGRKILIKGNHDHSQTYNLGWYAVENYYEITHNGVFVVMFHYPIFEWNKKFHGSIHLYGHVHNNSNVYDSKAYNMSAEMINYTPVNLDDITNQAKGQI